MSTCGFRSLHSTSLDDEYTLTVSLARELIWPCMFLYCICQQGALEGSVERCAKYARAILLRSDAFDRSKLFTRLR